MAYAIDSTILAIFAVAFVGVAALTLLLQTESGFRDVSDSALWVFVYISLASIPAWAIFMIALLWRRGQTIGQYITGLAVLRPDGRDPSLARLVLYLAALHPLVFHPVLGLFWILAALTSISSVSSAGVIVACSAMAILCVVAPLVAFVTGAADGGRRALHDRIAGLTVVRLE